MNIDNTYLKQKATGGAESDEKVAEVPATEFAEYITDIAAFMMYLISEKEKLSMAIRKAKHRDIFQPWVMERIRHGRIKEKRSF